MKKEDEDVFEYVQEKIHFFDGQAKPVCKEIGDGNLNYVFRIVDEASGKSIVVKQAGSSLRISKDMSLNIDQGKIEARILGIQGELRTGMVKHHIYPEFHRDGNIWG